MKKQFLLPILSTALLAPAFLAGQVYAEEATTPAESSAVVATPATSVTPAPVESPAVPETSATSEAVAPAETPSAPAESPSCCYNMLFLKTESQLVYFRPVNKLM